MYDQIREWRGARRSFRRREILSACAVRSDEMKRTILSIAVILAISPACFAGSSGDEEAKQSAMARYRASMKEGRKAVARKDWRVAVVAFGRALEAKPGDRAATTARKKAVKKLGVLPKGFEGIFEIPDADKDRYGNPANTRKGNLADPATGYPYEIRLKLPGGSGVMEFVLIPAGSFQMGSPASEALRNANEGPVHPVRITKPFYLAKYEVTQALWREMMGKNPSRFQDAGDDAPVEMVSWDQCKAFLGKLSESAGAKQGARFRLPTEAEWEYACRAGTETPFHFGRTATIDQVNYHGDYPYGGAPKGVNRQTTVRVGSFPANAWGLHDMHGNVWEWCEDVYSRDFYCRPGASKPDPICKTGSSLRVYRGGSWVGYAWYCRCATRDGNKPDIQGGYVGFRPVKPIE